MRHPIICLIFITMLSACRNSGESAPDTLFPQSLLDAESDGSVSLSDLFVEYNIIPLETSDKSLIGGRSNKILKRDSHFYIRSINDVVIFDSGGKFVNRLSAVGGGPQEYSQMYDFDVVPEFNEIWISSDKGICRYDKDNMEYTGIIPLPFFANQFKYLSDGTFIVNTSDEQRFKICSTDGEIISSYFQNDAANSGMKPVGFLEIDGLIVYQLENTDAVVCYDPAEKLFCMKKVVPETDGIVTPDINREYLDRYGYMEQAEKVSQSYAMINTFRKVDGMSVMIVTSPDKKRTLKISDGDRFRSFIFSPDDVSEIKNNIAPGASPIFYMTLSSSDSEDSFIFKIDYADAPDSNPMLLEVSKI